MEDHKCEFKKDEGFLDLRDGLDLYQCACGKSEKRPRVKPSFDVSDASEVYPPPPSTP